MPMKDQEISQMIDRTIDTILELRKEIEYLQPRANAYATVEKILDLVPGRQRGVTPDIVWELRRQKDKLSPSPKSQDSEESI